MIYIFLVVYIISFIVNTYVYKKKINFLNVIITLWVLSSILSMFGFYDMYIPNNLTYIYILCFIISLEVFSIFFYKCFFKKFKKVKNVDSQKEELNYKVLNIMLLILIAIMFIFAFEGIQILFSGGSFSDVRDAYLNHENFSNKLQMFISLVLVPFGDAIGIYTIIQYVQKKKISSSLVLYLIFLGEVIIYTGGRAKIVYIALILILALMDKYKNNIFKIIKENKGITVFVFILVALVAIITLQRNLQGKGLIYNIYCYFAGNINLLGVYLNNPERYLLTSDNLLYGQILISGFSYPILFLLELLGSDIKAGLYVAYEVTQQFVPISPNTLINNSVTTIYFALRDFGFWGIFIYSAVIALFFTYIYKRKEKNDNLLNKAIYYQFFKVSIFLIFDFGFANTGTILTFIYLILLYVFCVKNCENGDVEMKDNNSKSGFVKILEYLKHPQYILFWLDKKRILTLNDEKYIKILYERRTHKELNLSNPQTLSEKLQWLKLYDRNPEYTKLVDKYEVKKYVSEIIGNEYIIPTLGIYDKFEDINFQELPNQFVIKCTHDSASTIVCKDKNKFNYEKVKNKINKCLKRNYFYIGREWPYKDVKPRIIVEKYMENTDGTAIDDYKFYCFSGKVDYVMVCKERNIGNPKFYYFDRNWQLQKNMSNDGKKITDIEIAKIEKPKDLEKMFEIAETLSKNIKFVRTDLYYINNKIYFGELTFFPTGGIDTTRTKECDTILNNFLILDVNNKKYKV